MKPSPPEPPPTRGELLLISVIRSCGISSDDAIRRVSAGPVVQEPETGRWRRKPREAPKGWRVVSD